METKMFILLLISVIPHMVILSFCFLRRLRQIIESVSVGTEHVLRVNLWDYLFNQTVNTHNTHSSVILKSGSLSAATMGTMLLPTRADIKHEQGDHGKILCTLKDTVCISLVPLGQRSKVKGQLKNSSWRAAGYSISVWLQLIYSLLFTAWSHDI